MSIPTHTRCYERPIIAPLIIGDKNLHDRRVAKDAEYGGSKINFVSDLIADVLLLVFGYLSHDFQW